MNLGHAQELVVDFDSFSQSLIFHHIDIVILGNVAFLPK